MTIPSAGTLLGATLLVAALAPTVGCSQSTPDRPTASSPSATSSAPTSTTSDDPTTTVPTEPPPTRYQPLPVEVDAAAKRTAARAVEALNDVQQVTYTQYFGYLPPDASILVEADFVGGGGTTYDVRIRQAGDGWAVDSVTGATPPSPLEKPGRLIRRVLQNDRITLPWAGRADVAAGLVADSVLRSMLAVAEHHRIGISVLISAHPVNVFGTDRRSNHPDGRAYDIGRIDGQLVVDPGSSAAVQDVMRIAAGTGAYQVGGPEDLDGGGSQYFSDATHSDHVHVGFLS
ncbi:hypothetical protein F0U44_01100 [Nocardioides humilatus]|uniref:Peptidase M15C domain-containing protein n=1 Tax=Nocardioides humilatus TaxID=2607660 RepID=A0A5B1LMW2_9ACTN|nr:hypothetical protein [Nocardioides humilatus]KAA1420969.1 hypothetical protein F0U44_01100 [Nocardioides humilatus]